MEARDLLRGQYQQLHKWLHMTIADCTEDMARRHDSGWEINPINGIYLHIAMSQDSTITRLTGNEQPLLVRGGWDSKLGIDAVSGRQAAESAGSDAELSVARGYMATVTKAVEDFLESATDEQLLQEVDGPVGKMTAIQMLANIGVNHVAGHWGEIAALKGVQGYKGLRF